MNWDCMGRFLVGEFYIKCSLTCKVKTKLTYIEPVNLIKYDEWRSGYYLHIRLVVTCSNVCVVRVLVNQNI